MQFQCRNRGSNPLPLANFKMVKVMETKKFKDIPIYDFGNKLVISGIILTNDENESLLMMLPQKLQELSDKLVVVAPTIEEWKEYLHQTDLLEVEGKLEDDQKIVLRKGTRNVDGKISWKVFRRDKFKCRYCGISHVPLTVDHLVLWEVGGPTTEENLLTSCRKCNRTRGNMPYEEWIHSLYYIRKSEEYLTEKEREANLALIPTLKNMQKVPIIRNR